MMEQETKSSLTMIELWDCFNNVEKETICQTIRFNTKKYKNMHQGLLGLMSVEEVIRAAYFPKYEASGVAQGPPNQALGSLYSGYAQYRTGPLTATQVQAQMQQKAQALAAQYATQQSLNTLLGQAHTTYYGKLTVEPDKPKTPWYKRWFALWKKSDER